MKLISLNSLSIERIPVDFTLALTPQEWEEMRSQVVTSYFSNSPRGHKL